MTVGRGGRADVTVVPGRTRVRWGVYRFTPVDDGVLDLVLVVLLVWLAVSVDDDDDVFWLRTAAADMSTIVKYDVYTVVGGFRDVKRT